MIVFRLGSAFEDKILHNDEKVLDPWRSQIRNLSGQFEIKFDHFIEWLMVKQLKHCFYGFCDENKHFTPYYARYLFKFDVQQSNHYLVNNEVFSPQNWALRNFAACAVWRTAFSALATRKQISIW